MPITTTNPRNARTRPTVTPADAFFAELASSDSGWRIEVKEYEQGAVVTVSTSFEPNDLAAYNDAERTANEALRHLPMTYPGTVWGSDSGSVGGHAALVSGAFRMNKSGVGVRVARKVAKVHAI